MGPGEKHPFEQFPGRLAILIWSAYISWPPSRILYHSCHERPSAENKNVFSFISLPDSGGVKHDLHRKGCTAWHCAALHGIVLHCLALSCTVLHCNVLHCTVLRSITLYCTALTHGFHYRLWDGQEVGAEFFFRCQLKWLDMAINLFEGAQ